MSGADAAFFTGSALVMLVIAAVIVYWGYWID